VAELLGARSVAFPAVSAGAYGWPAEDAARIAVEAVRGVAAEAESGDDAEGDKGVREVRFVLFSAEMLAAFKLAHHS
jgi:O-acetyl-ADP-ribose deacetylase (regulator of RNase III)